MNLRVFTDGGSRGNPGPAAAGFVVLSDGRSIYESGRYLGNTTNNVAEYTAILDALEWLTKQPYTRAEITIHLDSRLVVEQLCGRFRIKSNTLALLAARAHDLIARLPHLRIVHVPRSENSRADRVVNDVLDACTA